MVHATFADIFFVVSIFYVSFITVERIYKQFISIEINNKSTVQHCIIEVASSLQERTRLSVCQIDILS